MDENSTQCVKVAYSWDLSQYETEEPLLKPDHHLAAVVSLDCRRGWGKDVAALEQGLK